MDERLKTNSVTNRMVHHIMLTKHIGSPVSQHRCNCSWLYINKLKKKAKKGNIKKIFQGFYPNLLIYKLNLILKYA